MTTSIKSVFLAAGLTLAGAVSAQAATVSFDLTEGNGTESGDSLVFDSLGLSLTTTAYFLNDDGSFGAQFDLTQTADGLGVDSGQNRDVDAADSQGLDEVIGLSFSQDVSITELTFSFVDGSDFAFGVLDGSSVEYYAPSITVDASGVYSFDTPAEADLFGVGSDGRNRWGVSNDWDKGGFFLTSVTVEADLPLQQLRSASPAPIPLPAGGVLLLTGLGGLAAMRRKRQISA